MKIEEYPLCLTVKEMAEILRVGINKAYDIVRTPGFPAIRSGDRIIIPRDAFRNWLMTSTL